MNEKLKSIISVIVFAAFTLGVTAFCIITPDETHSLSERRELAQFPEITAQRLSNGEFSKDFESYSTDQFANRDGWRSIASFVAKYILLKLEDGGMSEIDNHLTKADSPENEDMMNHAAKQFNYIYDTYLTDNKVYFSIVPDKNFVLPKDSGRPTLDYPGFIDRMRSKVSHMEYIDITDLLSADDYYYTDTHWRQEKITDIASRLAEAMGTKLTHSYTENTLDVPFYGVYADQQGKKADPDTIKYLTNDTIENAKVTAVNDKGMLVKSSVYNMEKAKGKDPYEMFLSGTMALVTMENPDAESDKELILFRDSYGSSIAPLFLSGYKKITLVDTRYIKSNILGNFVDFKNADVLFLYSSTLLNNSLAIG